MLPSGPAHRFLPAHRPGPRRLAAWSLVAVVGLAGSFVARTDAPAAATAQQASQEEPEQARSLLERLLAVEAALPPLPPRAVEVDEDEAWATLDGDFSGAEAMLGAVSDRLRDLYIDASDTDAPAVADAARSLLELAEAYRLLARWETYDLAFPLDGEDGEGVATGADEVYGVAEAGLHLLLDAHSRRLAAYETLRTANVAGDVDAAALVEGYEEEVQFAAEVRPALHRALSLDTTQVARVTDRFTTTGPGAEARARVARVECVSRRNRTAADHRNNGTVAPATKDCPDVPEPSVARQLDE